MELGIDFGTTRTVVAQVDRGNYPVVGFTDPDGDLHEFFPSVLAVVDGRLLTGFEAQAAAADGAPSLRSFKRRLADPRLTIASTIRIGTRELDVIDLLTDYLRGLYNAMVSASTISRQLQSDPITSVVAAIPAHARSAQRFLTLEAFRRAGFPVTALMNEPSAAGFEYTHRQTQTLSAKRTRLIVYDLGGGTFDASQIDITDRAHSVIDTVGLNHLGGDDFDQKLVELALHAAGDPQLSDEELAELSLDAQTAKEGLAPQSKRVVLEVGEDPVTVPVQDFYDAVTPLLDETLAALEPLVATLDDGSIDLSEIAGLYLVGGASALPIVARMLREHFGRRVQRSLHPAASTAIGLAIAADPNSGFTLADRVSRGFGVFREWDNGQELAFDSIFDRDQIADPLAGAGLEIVRRYRPAHNIGAFRFVEYGQLKDWQPVGEIVPFATVRFPYDPALQGLDRATIADTEVTLLDHPGDEIEEHYRIDQHGIVSVTIRDVDTGYTSTHEMTYTADED